MEGVGVEEETEERGGHVMVYRPTFSSIQSVLFYLTLCQSYRISTKQRSSTVDRSIYS